MNSVHKPVLSEETLKALNPQSNQNFIDCTLGGGGHAELILEQTAPNGKLLGLDWDATAIERSRERLSRFGTRFVGVNASYTDVKKIAEQKKFGPVHGALLDLGLSSDQLQNSGRGFSFQVNEPLDMRFSVGGNDLIASDIINEWPGREIEKIFREYGEERYSRRIVEEIIKQRKEGPIKTTLELVALIVRTVPTRRDRIHPATRVFQALRIAVNHELDNVNAVLKNLLEIIEPNGRIAVITFHSLEDRIVKQYFKQESIDCLCPPELPECRCGHHRRLKLITKKPIIPSEQEIEKNWRSRSAKLRVIEKI
ncbi:MAG: 16S rRNA (cytosine(1402)-N(4))-methyltransferase RsmH [Parcubacteria group bacterium]